MTSVQITFDGYGAVDETYIGGKDKNKHYRKKLHAGRGTMGKTATVGMKDRSTNQVRTEVVPDTKAQALESFVRENMEAGAKIYTDESRSYRRLSNCESVNHGVSQWVRKQTHMNGMESLWASLKRGYHGVSHHMYAKYLHRYANEFSDRHNFRSLDTIDQMCSIAQRLVGKRLKYQDLIR